MRRKWRENEENKKRMRKERREKEERKKRRKKRHTVQEKTLVLEQPQLLVKRQVQLLGRLCNLQYLSERILMVSKKDNKTYLYMKRSHYISF